MNVSIILRNLDDNYFDEVIVENIESKNNITYFDNNNEACQLCIFDDGICFFKQSVDHLLELHLKDHNYAKITTSEGILKFDVKVIDFQINSDILLIHYIVNDEARIIEIKYY